MTVLRFPAEIAVGEIRWPPAQEPARWGHRLAIGAVEVPDGTAVTLSVYTVEEVSVTNRRSGWAAPVGTPAPPAVPPGQVQERVTWHRDMPDRALRNNDSIWGGPEDHGCSIGSAYEAVDLDFVRALPADSVCELNLGDIVPASFSALAHLAPGLRELSLFIDELGEDAPFVIAELTALERLSLAGNDGAHDGPSLRLDDNALSAVASLPALEALSLLGGSYTEQGLRQLCRLPRLQHLHIEREDLAAPMFRFATDMPALTRLTGLDEFGDDGPMSPAEVGQVRAMLPPRISMD